MGKTLIVGLEKGEKEKRKATIISCYVVPSDHRGCANEAFDALI